MCGRKRLYISRGSTTAHTLLRSSGNYIYVPVLTFDKLCEILGLKNIDMLKLDVEGAEVEVISSMKILPSRVVMECDNKYYKSVIQALLNKGFYIVKTFNSAHCYYIYAIHSDEVKSS